MSALSGRSDEARPGSRTPLGLAAAVFAAGFVFRPLLGRSAQVTRIAGE